uniref:Uncharacterized protein n=1 Tax=Brassica oleracea TaxID=3712 RepID=A0A3P6DPT9_BRAOL|nr:unnamed protein product [Brassica oleracea]
MNQSRKMTTLIFVWASLPHLKSISRLFNLILTNLFIPTSSIPKL